MDKKYAYEFGKRWDIRTPRGDIRWLMGRVHVSASIEEITAMITERANGPNFTPAIIRQCVAYALECHQQNRALYSRVMG